MGFLWQQLFKITPFKDLNLAVTLKRLKILNKIIRYEHSLRGRYYTTFSNILLTII